MPTSKKTSSSSSTMKQSTVQAPPPATPAVSPAPPAPATTPPDPNAALAQYVQQAVTELDAIEVGLGSDPSLTPAQKRHALKFRKGGENVIGQIGNLAQQQGLESPALNVSDMMAMLGKAQDLQPLSNRVSAFAKHVDDVIFTAQSGALSMAQQYYALLQRRALTDAELATALAPVVAFFARKPKAKGPGQLSKPQTKATKKALATVKKNAPQLLQGEGTAATPVASAVQVAPVVAPANGAQGAPGNGAALQPVATTASHS
jgi:hypothetical protein